MMDNADAIMDDEKDTLNDETFGDRGEEYTWDGGDHLDDFFGADHEQSDKENVLHNLNEGELGSPQLRSGGPYYGGYDDSGYSNVEESISRLVLEDDDIEVERDRIIKASHRSLMPPQVITRNLNWFTEQDTKSSFFTPSIWAMHPTDVLQGSSGSIQTQQQSNIHLMNQQPQLPYRPPPGLEEKQCFRTLEEIESELHMTPPSTKNVIPQLNEQQQRLGMSGIMPQKPGQPMGNVHESHGPGHHLPPLIPADGRGMLRHPSGPPPGMQHNNLGWLPENARLRQPFMGRPGGMMHPPGMLPNMRQPTHGHARMMPPRMGGPHQHPRFRGGPDMMQHRGHRFSHQRSNHPFNENGSHDRYTGLMTEQDKQRLRNIQILQLQSDHPYTTDFYYQMSAFLKDKNIMHLRKVFPSKDEHQKKKKFKPTRFENALGKLQTVSALAPKRVMDTFLKVTSTSTNGKNSRSILWREIERVNKLYLNCLELSCRRVADTLHHKEDPMPEFMAYSKILGEFDAQGDNLCRWLFYQKGRELFLNCMKTFSDYSKGRRAAYMFLANLIKYSTVPSMQKMEMSPTFEDIRMTITAMITKCDLYLVDLLLQACHGSLWKSRFGCTIGLMILTVAAPYAYSSKFGLDWTPLLVTYDSGIECSTPLRVSENEGDLPGLVRFPTVLKTFMNVPWEERGMPYEGAVSKGFLMGFPMQDERHSYQGVYMALIGILTELEKGMQGSIDDGGRDMIRPHAEQRVKNWLATGM